MKKYAIFTLVVGTGLSLSQATSEPENSNTSVEMESQNAVSEKDLKNPIQDPAIQTNKDAQEAFGSGNVPVFPTMSSLSSEDLNNQNQNVEANKASQNLAANGYSEKVAENFDSVDRPDLSHLAMDEPITDGKDFEKSAVPKTQKAQETPESKNTLEDGPATDVFQFDTDARELESENSSKNAPSTSSSTNTENSNES